MFFMVLLLAFFEMFGSEVQESSLFKKDLRLVAVPIAGIYVAPDSASSYDSQKLYGHSIEVVEIVPSKELYKWVKVKTDDGIVGFMQTHDLVPDDICWRTSVDLERVSSLHACVYPTPSIAQQILMKLPYNAYVKICKDIPQNDLIELTKKGQQDNWKLVHLLDNKIGWVRTGNIEPITPLSFSQMIERVKQFVGIPYMWGGASPEGYDCSGFTQTIAQQLGYPMLRDSGPQSRDAHLISVPYEAIQPGDFVFFGKDRVSHAAFCIALNTIIHAAVIENDDKVMITSIDHPALKDIFQCARRLPSHEYSATIESINEQAFALMKNKSWQDSNPVPLHDLRLITVKYWGFDACMHTGQMVVHAEVAQEVTEIFKDLFNERYPIEKMKLIDEYDARDGFSCADNNSSAFCSRLLTNSDNKWSLHSFGIAIDINTRINPYYIPKADYVGPVQGRPFIDRTHQVKGLIKKNDRCYNAFIERRWKWAGDWEEQYGYVDYQHFYKEDGLSPELTALAKQYTPELT